MIWHPIDIAEELHKNGIKSAENRAIFVAVIGAETANSWDDKLDVVNTGGTAPGSHDRGLLQLNDHWHPEVSDECAFDGACSIKEGVRLYRERNNQFTAWNAYVNKLHEKYLPMARVAVEAALRARELTELWNEDKTRLEALEINMQDLRTQLEQSNEDNASCMQTLTEAHQQLAEAAGVVDRLDNWFSSIKGVGGGSN